MNVKLTLCLRTRAATHYLEPCVPRLDSSPHIYSTVIHPPIPTPHGALDRVDCEVSLCHWYLLRAGPGNSAQDLLSSGALAYTRMFLAGGACPKAVGSEAVPQLDLGQFLFEAPGTSLEEKLRSLLPKNKELFDWCLLDVTAWLLSEFYAQSEVPAVSPEDFLASREKSFFYAGSQVEKVFQALLWSHDIGDDWSSHDGWALMFTAEHQQQAERLRLELEARLLVASSFRDTQAKQRDRNDQQRPMEVFCAWSHKDEELRKQLELHLSPLTREGLISVWHFRKIGPGEEWKGPIDKHLETASVILLLISSDFMGSDYCYDVEMKRAMERHEEGTARVIPVILRPVDWQQAPFAKLQALPRNGKPVTSWQNRDEAFMDIAKGIRECLRQMAGDRDA